MYEEIKIVANPLVVLREEFDDWAILFHPETAEAVGINPVGVAIWKLLDGKRDLTQIAEEIRNQFDSVPNSVDQEVGRFIESLIERGFVGNTMNVESAHP